MTWQRETFKKIKQIPREEHVLPGTALCAGCGGLEALRLAAKVLGDEVVYVNAAGCFTMLAAYPFTPFKGSWLYTTMGSAPAGAQGVRDALDVLIAKGRLPERENLKVVVLGGDGSTYDMALSSTSGAITRKLDYYYFCYDNEAYGNTGAQLSPRDTLRRTDDHVALQPAAPGWHDAGEERHLRDLAGAQTALYRDRRAAVPIGSGRKIRAGGQIHRSQTVPRAFCLPHRLALRSGRDSGGCQAGGGNRSLAVERGDQRRSHPHLHP